MGVRLSDPKARPLRAPFWFNAFAAVMAVVLCGIYVNAGEWDGALIAVVLLAALLQAMSFQKDAK